MYKYFKDPFVKQENDHFHLFLTNTRIKDYKTF